MTERISHDEALSLAEALPGHYHTRTALLHYIRLQRALEADTVSRAELDRQVNNQIERAMRAESKLTALQAELETEKAAVRCYMADLETERARAEEAEEAVAVLEPQVERLTREHLRLGSELAAANARAARLEEEMVGWLGHLEHCALDLGAFDECERHTFGMAHARLKTLFDVKFGALFTAPQARISDTQCPRCGSHDRSQRGRLYRGGSQAGAYDCANDWHSTAPQASTEQAPPSPAVGLPLDYAHAVVWAERMMDTKSPAQPAPSSPAVGECDFDSGGFTPEMARLAGMSAQPAPGGTEQCEWHPSGACSRCGRTMGHAETGVRECDGGYPLRAANPTPAEPGGTEPGDCPHCGVQPVFGYSRCPNQACLRDLSVNPTPAEFHRILPPVDTEDERIVDKMMPQRDVRRMYVTYEVLIEALRASGPSTVADRLEKARGR